MEIYRMSPKTVLLVLALALPLVACGQSLTELAEKDDVYLVAQDDEAMDLAFRKAKDGLDTFLALARKPPTGHTDFAVKVGISENGSTEYFWIAPFTQEGESFVGILDNEPRSVASVRFGQEIEFSKDQIVDWVYFREGQMVGNFTVCAMLKGQPESEREQFEERFGLSCDA